MQAKTTHYRSYLLRLYGTIQNGNLVWRASLEHPAGGEKLGFSSIEALFHFLHDQCLSLDSSEALSSGPEA